MRSAPLKSIVILLISLKATWVLSRRLRKFAVASDLSAGRSYFRPIADDRRHSADMRIGACDRGWHSVSEVDDFVGDFFHEGVPEGFRIVGV
jgi:hypothetical protein